MDQYGNFGRQQEQNFDKTLDENQLGNINLNMPQSNTGGMVNPYTQPGLRQTSLSAATTITKLPDGNEQIPLGSGIIAGTLGEGGMAHVYRIWNPKLEMYRAVKVLLPTERPELKERFETEIKISAKLHHPNIVETYTVGDWNGLPYIEMELVEGVSLDYLIHEFGKIPPAVVTAIGVQVADALSYAHTQQFLIYGKTYNGVIHRDLKPANIMIGSNGVVKLMDFGIARPTEVGLHTVAGNIVGTLPYLSPEQLDESEIDQRSDIYSLGTILYEALTGEKTFPQQTVTNLMRMKIINSYRKFDSFSIDVPVHLGRAVEKCLSQDKSERFSTAHDLEEVLSDVYEHMSASQTSELIKQYIENPVNFTAVQKKKPLRIKHLKGILIGAGSVVAVGTVAGLLLMFPPKNPDGTTGNAVAKDTAIVAADNAKNSAGNLESKADTVVIVKHDTIPADVAPVKQPLIKPVVKTPVSSVKNPSKQPVQNVYTDREPASGTESQTELLVKKYNETNMVEIADAACRTSAFADAVTAIDNMPPGHPDHEKGYILQAHALIEQGKVSKAASVIAGFFSEDACYVLLEGRIALAQGKDKLALDKFEIALTRPSTIRNIQTIRNDALYYTAITYDNRYNATKSPETRQQALMAWNTLKRMYISQPDHPRFKLANQKLASF